MFRCIGSLEVFLNTSSPAAKGSLLLGDLDISGVALDISSLGTWPGVVESNRGY